MYSSNDGRFIVKQITQRELDVLLHLLDGYTRHMRQPIEENIMLAKMNHGMLSGEVEKQQERDRLEKLTVNRLLLLADELGLTTHDQDGNRTEWGLKSYLPRLLQCNPWLGVLLRVGAPEV